VTGIAMGAIAYRLGRTPLRLVVMVPALVVGVFALFRSFVFIDVPGTAILRGGGSSSLLIWIVVSILSSLACWCIAHFAVRRMR
jgi:hypothetical protein